MLSQNKDHSARCLSMHQDDRDQPAKEALASEGQGPNQGCPEPSDMRFPILVHPEWKCFI